MTVIQVVHIYNKAKGYAASLASHSKIRAVQILKLAISIRLSGELTP